MMVSGGDAAEQRSAGQSVSCHSVVGRPSPDSGRADDADERTPLSATGSLAADDDAHHSRGRTNRLGALCVVSLVLVSASVTARRSRRRPQSLSAASLADITRGDREPNRAAPEGVWLNGSTPHVVLMLVDDAGWNDVGYQSTDLQDCTPFLDSLSSSGIVLKSFYGMHECTPARTALLSGRYPISTGTYHASVNFNAPWGLPTKYKLLPQYLQEAGYATHMVGKWDIGHYHTSLLPNHRGFESFLGYYSVYVSYYEYIAELGSGCVDPNCFTDMHFSVGNETTQVESTGEYSTSKFGDRVRAVISEHDAAQPLFVYFAPTAMHGPLTAPSHTLHKYETLLSKLGNQARRAFAAALLALDETVHLIADEMDDAGMWNETVFLFMSDNGAAPFAARADEPFTLGANEGSNWPLRGRKFFLWEGGTRLPAFISSPLLPPSRAGTTYDGVFHISDWMPTIVGGMLGRADLLGNGTEDVLDGLNHWHALLGVGAPPRNEMVYNIDLYNGTIYHAAIRRGKWKFIWEFNQTWWPVPDEDYPVQQDYEFAELVDDEPVWNAAPHLFDLDADPNETNDLIADEPEIAAELVEKLNKHAADMQSDGGNLRYCTGDLPRAYDIFDAHQRSVVPWLTDKDYMDECSKAFRHQTGDAAIALEVGGLHWFRTALPTPDATRPAQAAPPAPTSAMATDHPHTPPAPTSTPAPASTPAPTSAIATDTEVMRTPAPTPAVITLHPTSEFIHSAHHGGAGGGPGGGGGDEPQ